MRHNLHEVFRKEGLGQDPARSGANRVNNDSVPIQVWHNRDVDMRIYLADLPG
jgi:hypothetical protein